MKLNKIGEVWKSASRLLNDCIGLLSSKNFATMATWRNDFSSLLTFKTSEKIEFISIQAKGGLISEGANDRMHFLFTSRYKYMGLRQFTVFLLQCPY